MRIKDSNRIIYQQHLNRVIEYIHDNLDTKIDIKTLADISNFSPFHFHRISRALLGESIGAYITRVKVETAAKMIRYTKLSIEEIAFSVGFEATSSLSKAFKNYFGISPSAYRKDKLYTIKTMNIMKTTLNIKKPKIIDLVDQNCIYYRMQGPYQSLDYGKAWKILWNQIKTQKLFTKGIQHIGLPYDDPKVTDEDKLRYDACLIIHKNAKPNGEVGFKTLNGGKFAVFLYQGSYKYFSQVYDYIFNEWLMDTNYELRDEPVRERYISHPDRVAENKLKTEFYLPIK
ncbi:AraC family transcriptional regulator [Pontimicrobium sp. SW4]|uniref:AraC family transcriptional regulator n=1 Tax=Pontimicrobium sp. SW4 TaxID=3153519 RepID=A0AAU7BX11_9FLAO